MSMDPDYFTRMLNQQMYGHLERRMCTAEAPMPEADKDRYRWSHPDARVIGRLPTANSVDLCRCPHCGLSFTSFPRPQ